jgi:Ion channel
MKHRLHGSGGEGRSRTKPRSLSTSLRERDGIDIALVGNDRAPIGELYHALIRMSWPRFIALFVLVFFLFNLIFAALYFLDPGGLNMPVADSATRFFNAFFFSVHTVATVGYGNMYPIDVLTNVIVVIEITFGATHGIVGLHSGRTTHPRGPRCREFAEGRSRRSARQPSVRLDSRAANVRRWLKCPILVCRSLGLRCGVDSAASVSTAQFPRRAVLTGDQAGGSIAWIRQQQGRTRSVAIPRESCWPAPLRHRP